jgi:tRNA pseudouridine55 synthase
VTGILLVDKPEGMSSAGAIRALKHRLDGAKVGHLGTLDPFASGLLPLCIGEATKVARYLLLEEKAYEGRIRLGRETDTLDGTGNDVAAAPVPAIDADTLEHARAGFVGPQRQTPPMYSALKRDGVPLYKLARKGVEVEREARDITIHALELRLVEPTAIDFVVRCSKGTYVRVLAADLGRALGTVAHLERLRRTAVGPFAIEQARTPQTLENAPVEGWNLIPIAQALEGLRRVRLDGPGIAALRHGRQDVLRRLPHGGDGEAALVLDEEGEVAAIVEMAPPAAGWRLVRLIAGSDRVALS